MTQSALDHSSKIFIAGHRGLVGSALQRCLRGKGYANIVTRTRAELDLRNQKDVEAFFQEERPDLVLLAAAKVGGIHANNTYPAKFIHENLIVQDNVIHSAWQNGCKRLLFLGSSCIYPRDCPQPMREEHLLSGPLEATNRPYALAKIAGIETCWAYNREYGTRYIAVMPTNLYGPGDNYDLANSHVLPALIRKMHEAKVENRDSVVIWGTGAAKREFLHSDDLAEACVFLLEEPDKHLKYLFSERIAPFVNIGYGKEITIAELARLVRKVIGFEGKLVWDSDKPDGTPRKLLDVSRMTALGWQPRIGLEEGIAASYSDFLTNQS